MSRSSRRGDSSGPALFPFLAVFLCTIGALILILVLTVSSSYASAKRDAEMAMTDIKDTSDIVQVMSEELVAQREDIKSKVERRRRDLADIEDHIARLTKSLDQLETKFDRIHSQVAESEADHSDKTVEIAELRKEIDQKKKELIEEIEKQKKRKPAFAVIPYAGSNGTSRRPVYLECTKQGVIVQPEGLLISLNDLRPPFGPGNPLDAALRILRLAYQQKDATFGISLPPYPLLIVRPDGIRSYAMAREAMSGWDDQYGYELVDGEMELKFPPSPVGLKDQLTSTVEMAKRRQQALIASMPRHNASQDRDDNWDRIDASNDTQNTVGGNSAGSFGMGDNGASKSESSSGLVAGNSTHQNWQLVQGLANSQVSSAIQKNGIESSQSVNDPNRSMIPGNTPQLARSAFAMNGVELSGQYAVSGVPNASLQTALQPGMEQGIENRQAFSENQLRPNPNPGAPYNSGGTTAGSIADASSSGASTSGTNANGSTDKSSTAGGNSDVGKGSSGSNAPAPPGANAFSSGTAAGGGASSMSATGSPVRGDPSAAPSLSVSMNQKAERQKTDGQASKAKHVRAEGDLKPISVSAGHGWAASRAEGKATPVSRPINIVVLKDRWLLRSDAEPNVFEVNVTMEEGPQQAGNQLATAMRKRVDSWGLSVPGGYWSPTLTIEAASDAQHSVARLERLLEGSGVEIKVVPLTLPNRR